MDKHFSDSFSLCLLSLKIFDITLLVQSQAGMIYMTLLYFILGEEVLLDLSMH
jgi:hypothetical protein